MLLLLVPAATLTQAQAPLASRHQAAQGEPHQVLWTVGSGQSGEQFATSLPADVCWLAQLKVEAGLPLLRHKLSPQAAEVRRGPPGLRGRKRRGGRVETRRMSQETGEEVEWRGKERVPAADKV